MASKNDPRIRWTPEEWELMCAFILQKYELQCTASSEYAAIGVKEIELAMKLVIPRGRQREHLPVVQTRLTFIKHMTMLKKKIQREQEVEAENKRQQKEMREAVEREEKYARQRTLELNEPLVAMMMQQFTGYVVPALLTDLRQMVRDEVRSVLVDLLGSTEEKKLLEQEREAEERINKLTEIRPRPRVAVIGTVAVQSESLAKEYPNIDFVRIDKSMDNKSNKAIRQAVHGCDFVFGMQGKMSGNIRDECIESVVGKGKYKKVPGSTSALKREVAECLRTNQIQLAN